MFTKQEIIKLNYTLQSSFQIATFVVTKRLVSI